MGRIIEMSKVGFVLFFLPFSSMYQKTLKEILKKCEIQQVNQQLPRQAIAFSFLVPCQCLERLGNLCSGNSAF